MYDYSELMKEVSEYIGRKFYYGAYIHLSLENKTKAVIPVPSRPIKVESDISLSGNQKFIWVNNKAEYFKHETKLEENLQKAYTLIFGKCTEHMCSKLEAPEDYHTMWGKYDVYLLLVAIKGPTYKFDIN